MSGSCLSNVYREVRKWNDHHNVFSKAALFVSGLVLSHSLVDHAVMSILILYLQVCWKKQDLPKAVAIITLQDGVTTVLAFVLTHVADPCIGRFKMVFFTTVAYISGLVLLWYSNVHNPSIEIKMFYAVAVLLALGKAGRDPPLRAFLADQLIKTENPNIEEQEKIDGRANVWWQIAWFSGAIIAFFYLSAVNWEKAFIVSALVMGANLFLFLCGFKFYNRQIPNGSPLGIIVGVFKAAISNRHLNYPPTEEGFHWKNDTPSQFYNNGIGQTFLMPKVRFFRWLDKAAIIEEGTNPEDEENRGRLCTAKQVTEVRGVLTLIPLWITFFGFSLVGAAGNTFFIQQSNNMEFYIAVEVEVPIVSFFILRSFIRFIIPFFLFSSKKAREQSVTRIRIAIGMVCSIICCLRARDVEVVRLKIIKEKGIDPSDPNQTIPMNVLCLFPQFFWLGLMEGLANDGLQEFFYNHVATSMRSYGPSFSDCVLGFGNFISMPFVLLYRRWFKDSINTSHLDRYYLALAILSSVLLVFYVCASFSVTSVHMGSASENEEANEGEELAEILVDNLTDAQLTRSVSFSLRRRNVGHVDTAEEVVSEESRHDLTESLPTRSVSSSILKRKLVMAANAISFFLHLKNKTAANADSHESEKLPLRSHAVTEAEGVVLEESRQD